MSTASQASLSATSEKPEGFSWSIWPLRDGAPWSLASLVALTVVVVLVHFAAGNLGLGFLTAGLLAASLWRFFLPVRYTLTREGLEQQLAGRVWLSPWNTFRSCEHRPGGFVLYRAAQPTSFDALRALYLPCGEQQDAVAALLSRHLPMVKADPERA